MQTRLIATTPGGEAFALRHQGILVADSYAQIAALVEKNLSAEHALLFAEPARAAESGGTTDWYTAAAGPLRRMDELDGKEKEAALASLRRIAADIDALARELAASEQPAKSMRGHILSLALRYPDPGCVHFAGNQPVLLNWGHDPATPGMVTEPLMRLGAAVPLAPAAAPQGGTQSSKGMPGRAGIAFLRPLAFLLLGMLLAAALYALLFSPAAPVAGHVPGCSRQAAVLEDGKKDEQPRPAEEDASLKASLAAEQERERALRAELESLRWALGARLDDCPQQARPDAPGEPLEPEPPLEPPLLADLLPQTPEPEETPPPEKKKTQPPKKEPQRQKTPKGEDLRIPKDAHKNNDLSFLDGCWEEITGTTTLSLDLSRGRTDREYCFDTRGQGTRRIKRYQDNDRCQGASRAQFDISGNLIINSQRAQCGKGTYHVKNRMVCKSGADGKAQCNVKSENGINWKVTLRRK